MIRDPVAVFAALAAVVYVSIRLEGTWRLFRSLGAAMTAILLALALSNLRVLPGSSPAYDLLMGPGVSVGVALILLGVDVRSIIKAGPTMSLAFGLGAAGTAAGALTGGILLAPTLGAETWQLVGQFTGTYIGGSLNFAALGQAFGTSSDLFTAANAADVILTATWMAVCLLMPLLVRTREADRSETKEVPSDPRASGDGLERALIETGRSMSVTDGAALATLAVSVVWCGDWLSAHVLPVPSILWVTTLVLALAQIPAVRALPGGPMWGNLLLLLFLASIGASSVIATLFVVGPAVFYLAAITVVIHGAVLFGLGYVLRLDMSTLTVASQACVGGPASAMALASARGYTERMLPGIAVGLLGYAVGNYVGFAVAQLARRLLTG